MANHAKVWNQQKECDEVFLPYGDQAKPLTVLGKFQTLVEIEDAGRVYDKVKEKQVPFLVFFEYEIYFRTQLSTW